MLTREQENVAMALANDYDRVVVYQRGEHSHMVALLDDVEMGHYAVLADGTTMGPKRMVECPQCGEDARERFGVQWLGARGYEVGVCGCGWKQVKL